MGVAKYGSTSHRPSKKILHDTDDDDDDYDYDYNETWKSLPIPNSPLPSLNVQIFF